MATTFISPTCAKEAADYAEKLAHHQSVEHKTVLGTQQVTSDNAALYQQYDLSGKVFLRSGNVADVKQSGLIAA